VVVTVSETARFQAKAAADGAVAPFLVLPAGVQPAPAVPGARPAWAEECVAVGVAVAGADELVIGAQT